jgi:hypothetical protein
MSSNSQNCSILSQKVPKFELYNHNDELFNIYYRRCLCEFPIGSYVKLSSAVGSILIEGQNRRTHFWKRTIQWLLNCSILSQKVPKFELYKHNDELFNIYYGIFNELWTFAYVDRLCKLEKRRGAFGPMLS